MYKCFVLNCSKVAAEGHRHTQASKAGDHAVSSNLQYLSHEERIGFNRRPGSNVVIDETIGKRARYQPRLELV